MQRTSIVLAICIPITIGLPDGTRADEDARPVAWVLDRTHRLQLISREGDRLRRRDIAGVNIDLKIGGNRVISASPDGRFAVAANAYDVVDKLFRIDADGTIRWSIKGGRYTAVHVAKTGFAYAIKSGPQVANGAVIQKIDAETGEVVKSSRVNYRCFDIVADDRDEVVWVAGQAITKLDLDLREEWTIDPIPWYAVSIDYGPDGSLFVAEGQHSPGLGQNRMIWVDADGAIRRSFPLDYRPARVVASRGFWDVWVIGRRIARFNPRAGDAPEEIAAGPATYADVGSDGSLWLMTSDGELVVRSRDGQILSKLRGFRAESSCLDVIREKW
jgi:hypothetical protein